MNKKAIFFLSALAAVVLAAPLAMADQRGGGGGRHFAGAPARGGFARGAPTMARGAGTFNHWNGNRWSGNWRHRGHFRDRDRFIFIGGFGFPYFYGYPYYGYYPYSYYGYGYYPYGYSAPYGYDYGYNSGPAYGYNYGDRDRRGSSVVALQRRLARAGYYHGAIDGIMGPETRRAMRTYERSRGELSVR